MSTTTVKERPILFAPLMVRAILAGRKTQTRRLVRGVSEPDTLEVLGDSGEVFLHSDKCQSFCDYACGGSTRKCPYGVPGDRLWVRESFSNCGCVGCASAWPKRGQHPVTYRAGYVGHSGIVWYPSIHMPRWASRLTLEITNIGAERLQDISEADALSEGVTCAECGYTLADAQMHMDHPICERRGRRGAAMAFRSLWESINGSGSWDSNPWVWAVTFKRVEEGQ